MSKKWQYLLPVALVVMLLFKYQELNQKNQSYSYSWPISGTQTVAIVTYNDGVSAADLKYVPTLIEQIYRVRTKVFQHPPEELATVRDPDSGRIDAQKLVKQLELNPELKKYYKTLALIHQDLQGGDGFELWAEGKPSGEAAVLTTKGYVVTLGGVNLERVLHKMVLRTLVLHVLGHLIGLEDCGNDCAMSYTSGKLDELKKNDQYCDECEKRLVWLSESRFQNRRR